ncbi:relaxase/mobilization nuclease domain-containing protein [Ahrensia marina]|uniref:relaxase/mobilization nuclease domain-containing protein n=1 Tax=Ahrensia marina TaxID=1514904 RepID=UPI0006B42E86|nr:relaxase/mobilization nuclease domain-containing protein [Ahrensia marina]
MTVHVPSLLKDQHTGILMAPVDIVMGTPWGEIDPGNSLRLSLLYHVFDKYEQDGKSSGRLTTRSRYRSPQSFVKVIRQGGTSNASGMRAQMNYLTQKGSAELKLSDLYFGVKLEDTEREELIESWNITSSNKGDYDKTKHIVVSFPQKTNKEAAYRIGRAWAAEMFSSGKYGDVYDYYTAFHTDRDHPHIHIVVNRRGMEHGNWLSIHREGAFNYATFRALQVELSAQEGIYLSASSRHARGLSDRPISDAEYRRAEKEGRKPIAPSHSPITAMKAAASIALYAGQYSSDARLIRNDYPDLAKALREMAATLVDGRQIKPDRHSKSQTRLEEAKKRNEFIMSRRSEILASINEIDAEIDTLPFGKQRSLFERDAARIKAEAALHLPDVAALVLHTRYNPDGLYKGIEARDGVEREIKERADRQVAKLAKEAGLDPDRIVSRYDRATPASIGLADRWRKDELEDIKKNLSYQDNSSPRKQLEPLAQAAYDELHRNALQTYRKAERDLQLHAARKKQLYRIAKLIQEDRMLQENEQTDFRRTVKETLTSAELRDLEAGQTKVLKQVTTNQDAQRALGRRYLEAESLIADDGRKTQLKLAMKEVDRQAEQAAQLAVKSSDRSNSKGLDL